MMTFAATISPLYMDLIFSRIPRMPSYGEEVFAGGFDIQLGGGSMVPAVILHRFGVRFKFGTFLSEDETSRMAEDMLRNTGLPYQSLYDGKACPVVVTSVSTFPDDRCFTCFNPRLHEHHLSEEQVYDFYKGSKVCFVFEGYDAVFERLRNEGSTIVFDCGWDDDLDVRKLEHIFRYTDVFTPNDKEALKMTGTENVSEALRILHRYVKHPIVKTGAFGCATVIGDEIIQVPMPVEFDAVDTTGAGDNFLAGIMYGLYHDWDITDCMKFGNVLGGYSTTAVGCYGASITLDEAMEIMRKY